MGSHGCCRRRQSVTKLTGTLAVIDGGGANVTAFSTGEGLVLVDSGAPKSGDAVMAALKGLGSGNAKVQTLFNTHYHLDQTGQQRDVRGAGRQDRRANAHPGMDVVGLLGSGGAALREGSPARPRSPPRLSANKGSMKAGQRRDRLRLPADGAYHRRPLRLLQERERDRRGRCRFARARSRARLVHGRLGRRPRGFHGSAAGARQRSNPVSCRRTVLS